MISKNAELVPSNVRIAVVALVIVAVIAEFLVHFVSRIFEHYLWYAIGAVFLALSIYIYGLRSES
jgi:bacteriorhodopsin